MTAPREVFLEGPSPWGFRMTGGADVGHPLRISRVNPGSKAESLGVREGALITSINGQQTSSLTNAESHVLLRTVKENLKLGLNETKNASPKRRSTADIQRTETGVQGEFPEGSTIQTKGDKNRNRPKSGMAYRLKRLFGFGKTKNHQNDENYNSNETLDAEKKESREKTPDKIFESCLVEDNKMTIMEGEKEIEFPEVKKLSGDYETVCVSVDKNSSKTTIFLEPQRNKSIFHSPEECLITNAPTIILVENNEYLSTEFCNATIKEDKTPPIEDVSEEDLELRSCLESLDMTTQKNNIVATKDSYPLVIGEVLDPTHLSVGTYCPWRYLEVITEESSDVSDVDKPQKSDDFRRITFCIPDVWDKGSVDGIDTSWQNGKSLDAASGLLIASDSLSDTDSSSEICRDSMRNKLDLIFPAPGLGLPQPKPAQNTAQSFIEIQLDEKRSLLEPVTLNQVELVFIDTSDSEASKSDISSKSLNEVLEKSISGSYVLSSGEETLYSPFPLRDITDEENAEVFLEKLTLINKTFLTTEQIVADMNKEVECLEKSLQEYECLVKQVLPLRELCANVILGFPCGNIVLRDFGVKPSEYLSDYLASEYSQSSATLMSDITKSSMDILEDKRTEGDYPESSASSGFMFCLNSKQAHPPEVDKMTGIFCNDNRTLVGLSPLGSKHLFDVGDASDLLDLHHKFIKRRGYHEPEPDLIPSHASKVFDSYTYTPEILSHFPVEGTKSGIELQVVPPPEVNLSVVTVTAEDGKEPRNLSPDQSRLMKLLRKETEGKKEEKNPIRKELMEVNNRSFDSVKYRISKQGDIAIYEPSSSTAAAQTDLSRPKSLPAGELFRQRMYEEYMGKVAERLERRQQKVIKLASVQTSLSVPNDMQHLENEFMEKVKERMLKLGLPFEEESSQEPETEDRRNSLELPKHLQELAEVMDNCEVWSPAQTPEAERKNFDFSRIDLKEECHDHKKIDEPKGVIWTPGASPVLERKFRSVNFESPPPRRKEYKSSEEIPELPKSLPLEPSSEENSKLSTSCSENSSLFSQRRLPASQNPTITLLQKAREGQIPKGAQYLDERQGGSDSVGPNEIFYAVKREIQSDSEGSSRKIVELAPRKFEGIGPTARDGTPLALRSEVKETNQQKWYKRMYESLHKAEQEKDNVTVKYKTKWKGHYSNYAPTGYLSEPERVTYDSDTSFSKYATLDRRRARSRDQDFSSLPRNNYGVRNDLNIYKNQPGRIEDYEPGKSSISEKETKQWWDEVLDIFNGELKGARTQSSLTSLNKGRNYSNSSKDTGYESDSMLFFTKRREMEGRTYPMDQKVAYKTIQQGGEVPFQGLRKPAPERPKESPHKYLESEVNIHYKSPIRMEAKEAWPEEELAQRQAEAMRRIYQEQRRTKYLNELQDMSRRRHTDYFIPSQKSPIPLNRYDDFPVDPHPPRPRDRTPEPKLVAKALFSFIGQSSRELSFRQGDVIFVRRQIDKNWYEGEHNAMVGLFPINYVEIISYDGIRTYPRKATEGQARAKFNFQAQTHLELSLVRGELVLLTRKVDENWFEGRIGNRKGIFPVSYVEVLVEPGEKNVSPYVSYSNKPLVAPASHSIMLNGAKDLGQQHYQPPRPAAYNMATLPSKHKMSEISLVNSSLHIDTLPDSVPYRVLYNYRPQNDDELELREGELVNVMEKCDDGWYVGSLQRNGSSLFGTFPGNYVERLH